MNFSRFLDIQSWWEVPSIAYFCSLFRTAFNLLDFDIEELEEALLTDGTEDSASSLLTELIVRLLNGCLGNNEISPFNYQMYLRRLFRRKCQETGRCNPFNTDIDFQFLPLRTKVEILYALCDFRLDAEDVFDLFKNLEAESLRVEPLGWDDNYSAYWYFYGTRLYREDVIKKTKGKKKKKGKESKKRGWFYGDDWLDDEDTERVWQVVCFTEEDWTHLTEKFSKATSKVEKELYRSLSQNFLPEIPRLFQEKERLQRKRLLEAPRRTSSRVLQKIKQKEEEQKQSTHGTKKETERKVTPDVARENRAKRRNLLRSKSSSSATSENSSTVKEDMPQKVSKKSKDKKSKNSTSTSKSETLPEPLVKTGRKTNNSLASATGQILIPDNDEQPVNSTRKKLKTSQIFGQSEEDIQTDMYKVLEQLSAHDDAWPFMDPVEEEYAPNYYAVIRRPMDLRKMEEKLDKGCYTDFSMFKADFKLIVNNCRLYNGQDNEYTTMVDNLQTAFDKLTEKYIHRLSSSDEEIAVEYQLPTPSRKHKLKSSESPSRHKRKKLQSQSESGDPKPVSSDTVPVEKQEKQNEESLTSDVRKSKGSHKNKEGKSKKKRKGHHRHGKHSKNHKKGSHRSEHSEYSKTKHSKKQKHTKNRDRESKKSKQKKKKSKHHELPPPEIVKRETLKEESIESSNRSRSASPLPSIHTLTPSPPAMDMDTAEQVQPEKNSDPDFFKDKYDKIKERTRVAAKDAWDSLFDYKHKSVDKQKQNLHIPEKDKNQKLRETIEKLKAKNEKYKDSSIFNNVFKPGHSSTDKVAEINSVKESPHEDGNSAYEVKQNYKGKPNSKKGTKKNSTKNECASEALEQVVKDISKWLDDAPKTSTACSPSDSPPLPIPNEEPESNRLDEEVSSGEKCMLMRKDMNRKRPSSREPKLMKRREIQRTIDRLQPGKSKGNLLTNMSNKINPEKTEEVTSLGPLSKARDNNKGEESSPRLSLGSVLPTVEFTIGNDHNFVNTDDSKVEDFKDTKSTDENKQEKEETQPDMKTEDPSVVPNKKDAEVETEPLTVTKPNQEKATPNLSAWFKAFGAPKNTNPISTATSMAIKRKTEDADSNEKPLETNANEQKPVSPMNVQKYDSLTDSETPNIEGGDSPLLNVNATPKKRRTSTGSSVSERSSFSQDLDSPRHQMSHTSPLLRSPASPRTDDFQKITYPIINGTVRAGFYQDTTSMKSSPDKSCSPREAPQSPYSPYSQHVYASNNVAGSSTPNYFVDHNKSPLPTYTQNPPPFYDTSKAAAVTKLNRAHEDYTAMGPDAYSQSQYTGPFSPAYSPYAQTSTNYSQGQQTPLPTTTNISTSINAAQITADTKSNLYPVKKRMYNEPDNSTENAIKPVENKDIPEIIQNKNEYQKITQSLISISSIPSTAPSVDEIALALTEKSEMAKLNNNNNTRDKTATEYIERQVDNRETMKFETHEIMRSKNDGNSTDVNQPLGILKKDNIDMINMGYMNPEFDRRNNIEAHNNYSSEKDISKGNTNIQQKGYEVEAIAINLGMNHQAMQKPIAKPSTHISNIPLAHSKDRAASDMSLNLNIPHAHSNQYDSISSGQPVSNFSINDIEMANKKFYASDTTPSGPAISFSNWKVANQLRKQEALSSPYASIYGNSAEKLRAEMSSTNLNVINYNKNLQHQQYNAYNLPRTSLQRTQDVQQNLPAELRIPNPRGFMKNDHSNVSSIVDTDLIAKTIETHNKPQKSEKIIQNHPLVNSSPYKAPYSNHTSLPLDTLRNLPNIPQMLERYPNEERYLASFSGGTPSIYHDKSFQMAQMFNKSMPSDVHPISTSVNMYSQSSASINKDSIVYKTSSISTSQPEIKTKAKRKRTSDTKQTSAVASQSYHASSGTTDVLSSVKTSMMPASAFNFGSSTNMALSGALYGDNTGFSIEDFRSNTAKQLMAANYMVAAVAHQQRTNVEVNSEKLVKPAHQNSTHTAGSFPYLGHTQVRAGYPFVSADPTSPLYQQYIQRHQEEIFRQTGAQIMSLYPTGYPASLGVRQPYDTINRPSWL